MFWLQGAYTSWKESSSGQALEETQDRPCGHSTDELYIMSVAQEASALHCRWAKTGTGMSFI